jgi:hypothetical protein
MRMLSSVLLLTTVLAVSAISLVAVAHAQDDPALFECFSREGSGLLVRIQTAALAWPGDNVTITVNATATHADIHIRSVHVRILSLKENRSETVLGALSLPENTLINLGGSAQVSHTVSIPENSVPGLLYGEVDYAWSIAGDDDLFDEAATFPATYVQNKPYQDLLEDYAVLQAFADDLQSNYTDLQAQYQTLADNHVAETNATGLMYVFLITTAIFVVTTILLLVTHPKTSTY